MQTDNRFLDDLTRLASGAIGAAAAAREEIEATMKAAFRRWLSELDLVTRDEFETVRALAENAMEKVAALEERIARLEAAAAAETPGTRRRTRGHAAGKQTKQTKKTPPRDRS